ncbi:hypothetical protein LNQ52_12870 [Klebsiella pneumoniae subsp. pneumoniae]|nr:hypothetical protein [Klebsiella pneumoniae subsp. pneumoniae]
METQDVDHPGLAVSRITAKTVQRNFRRQTGVIFPGRYAAAGVKRSVKARPAAIDETAL